MDITQTLPPRYGTRSTSIKSDDHVELVFSDTMPCKVINIKSDPVCDTEIVTALSDNTDTSVDNIVGDTLPIKVKSLKNNSKPEETKNICSKCGDSEKLVINTKESLLTTLILNRVLDQLKNGLGDEDDEDDEEYEDVLTPIDGQPDDICYMEEEEDYIKSLSESQQKELFDMEKKIIEHDRQEVPQRFKILSANLDISIKSNIIRRLDYFYSLEESDSEYFKIAQWIESLDKIPFGIYSKQPISLTDESDKIIDYLSNVNKTLNNAVYGHDDAKLQIIQEIANRITNPDCTGSCIAIQGPPGNGKTTLVKEGVCKAVNKPFGFIALGGMTNSDFLNGHDYTYEGSKCGRIIEIIQESKVMDPLFYFDELDKLSECPKGEEIANLLCHLTDQSQNKEFHDKYFSGISFDLSKATFIFSYNDESKINPVLLDRMYKIHTKGFDVKDKLKIATDYSIPRICKSIGFSTNDIIFDDKTLTHIINQYTFEERGVRNMGRCIETIVSKLNLFKLLEGYSLNTENTSLDTEKILENLQQHIIKNQDDEWVKSKIIIDNLKIKFGLEGYKLPIKLTVDMVDNKLLQKDKIDEVPVPGMYM